MDQRLLDVASDERNYSSINENMEGKFSHDDHLGFEPVTFSFHNLSYAIKKKKQYQDVLKGISGLVKPGETMAIMGPSGAGKSTLLNILAGREMKSTHLTGDIFVNDSLMRRESDKGSFKQISGYVMQDDCLLGHLTVMETLTFYAKMRLPFKMPFEKKIDRVNYILRLLGLEHVKNSKIGTSLVRGISGGERKRVSIAVELITSPGLLFVDEPTSGLDGFNAVSVVEALVKLAKQQHTVIFTIHQPRAFIFHMFDKLLLLSEGRPVYFGDCRKAVEYFSRIGYPLPMEENPADFLLDLVTLDSRVDTTNKKRGQVESLIDQFESSDDPKVMNEKHITFPKAESFQNSAVASQNAKSGSQLGDAPFFYQFITLLIRNLLYSFRNPEVVWIKIGTAILIGCITGSTFWRLGDSQSDVQDRINSCFFVPVYMALSAINAIPRLIEERLLFVRERSNGTYGTLVYFLAYSISEIPITLAHCILFDIITVLFIGLRTDPSHFGFFILITCLLGIAAETIIMTISSVSKTFNFANSATSGITSLSLLFGGFAVSPDHIVVVWKWIYWSSFFQWGFTAIVINEFEDTDFNCVEGPGCPYPDGEAVFDALDISNRDKWTSVIVLLCLCGAFKVINYCTLRFLTKEKN